MQPTQPDFKAYLKLIRRRKELFLLLALLLTTLVFAFSYLLPRKYEASSTVFIEKNMVAEMVKGITVTPPVDDTVSVLTYALTSRWLVSRAFDSLGLGRGLPGNERETLIRSLQEKTTVKVKDRNLFTISYTGGDPVTTRDFVNTLVRVYIEQHSSANLGQSADANEFLSQQIGTFRARLDKAEQRVNAYKLRMGGVITLDETRLFQEIGVARQKLYDLQLRRGQLEGARGVSRLKSDPLQTKLDALQKKLQDLRAQYTDSYPDVVMVRGEIESVRAQIRGMQGRSESPPDDQETAKLDAEIAAIASSEENLRSYISSNNALLRQIPAAKAGLERLETERQNEKALYDQFFARQGQSEVSKQMEVHDKALTFRVVDPAILPVKPVGPNRFKIMLVGMMAALGGSFGALLLIDGLDESVKDLGFVKGLEAPVLAVIPRLQEPAVLSRRRRQSCLVLGLGTVYLLFLSCFPVLEFLGLPYVDRLVDQVHDGIAVHLGTGLSR